MTTDTAMLALRRVAKQIESAIENTEHEIFAADSNRRYRGGATEQQRALLQAKLDGLRLANSFVYESLANEKDSEFRRAWEAAQADLDPTGSL